MTSPSDGQLAVSSPPECEPKSDADTSIPATFSEPDVDEPSAEHQTANESNQSDALEEIFTVTLLMDVAFDEIEIASNFIRKVCGIVAFHLTLLFTICGICLAVKPIRQVLTESDNVSWSISALHQKDPSLSLSFCPLPSVLYISTMCTLVISTKLRRRTPYNYILLLIMVLSMTAMMALVLVNYNMANISTAFVATIAAVLMTLATLRTDVDLTYLTKYKWALVFFGAYFTLVFVPIESVGISLACYCAFLSAHYIIVDVQMISNAFRYAFFPEDYILAAATLCIDIVELFVDLLEISAFLG